MTENDKVRTDSEPTEAAESASPFIATASIEKNTRTPLEQAGDKWTTRGNPTANEENQPRRYEEGNGSIGRTSNGNITEAELLKKASAVGEAGMRYPDGKWALSVEGSGPVAAYGSSEMAITFAPLSVGDFRMIKVCARAARSGGRSGGGGHRGSFV